MQGYNELLAGSPETGFSGKIVAAMTTQFMLLALIPAAYLAGSIPFGLIVGMAKGVDPRQSGSGNIGATNVGRLLGMKYFALVFSLDMLKGMLPMVAGSIILAQDGAAGERSATLNLLHLLIGFAGICGHMFSCFLRFTGGKGVATSAGVALGLYPFFTFAGVIAIAVWAIFYAVTRYVSLASLVAAIVFPLAFVALGFALGWEPFGRQLPLFIFAVLVAVMIIVRHRSNIARLRSGTESQFSGKSPSPSPSGKAS